MLSPFPERIRKIGVIAPAGRPDQQQVKKALELLSSFGHQITVMPNVLNPGKIPYLSADTGNRLDDFLQCCKLDVDAIICARGGYGSMHLLPIIDWAALKHLTVPFLGYSDICALQLAMMKEECFKPMAFPVLTEIETTVNDAFSLDWCRWSLGEGRAEKDLIMPQNESLTFLKDERTEAPVCAINLTLLCSLLGTPYVSSLYDKILILEDINEELYAIDRKLTQLYLAGFFTRCKGIVMGSFKNCGSKGDLLTLFQQFIDRVNGPLIVDFPFGHQFPKISLPYDARLLIGNSELTFFRND